MSDIVRWLREHDPYDMDQDANAELEGLEKAAAKIEELEKDRDFWAKTAKGYKDDYNGLIRRGIVRCGVCGDEKPSMEWGEGALVCSNCDGHGWVIGGDDE